MRARHALAATMVVLAAIAACGTKAPDGPAAPATTASPAIPPVDGASLRYTCGRFPFGADLLEGPGTDDLADDPLAAVLRDHLARPDMDIDWLPDAGWTLVGRDATGAEYVAVDTNADSGAGLFSVSLTVDGGGWHVTGWGGCQPMRVLPRGLGEATWDLAPGQSIGPDTTVFEALVTERDCASGRPSEGRLVGPDILVLDGRMLVTFAVRPLGGDAQTCQGNPATSVTVVLPERLGERRLLDGSTLPPREPIPES